ncbi:IclR family transcriptional regulator domain-containing protein [Nitrobacter sp.]|uniref:IclR family transcriptional regulator domain-containing protein n=1 Tax=Nitrobacter sp. TaxID=29420 RepID=UPI003F64ED49
MRPGCFRRPSNLERFTDKTIVSLRELRGDLKLARKRGFAFDDEERKMGMGVRCRADPERSRRCGGAAGWRQGLA